MRYLVALVIGVAVLFGVNFFAELSSMSRPWGSLLMGAVVGITMVLILLIWEAIKPSHKDTVPAKPAMSDEERANARAERRARLAAEAGVSLDGIDESERKAQSSDAAATDSPNQPANSEPDTNSEPAENSESDKNSGPAENSESDKNSGPAENSEPDESEDEMSPKSDESSIEAEPGVTEPDTLAPDEYDEEATGSSLENPPTGEPGISVDALEDAESADTDDAADASASGDETTGDSDSKS